MTANTFATSRRRWPPTAARMWYSLAAGDFNHDGRIDLVAGNLGSITRIPPRATVRSASMPARLPTTARPTRAHEDDRGESIRCRLPVLGNVLYTVGVMFPTYAAYSTATVRQVLSELQLQRALHLQADTFASVYLQNQGNNRFAVTALPNLSQISPVREIIAVDVDGDGNLDLVVAGISTIKSPIPRRAMPEADCGSRRWPGSVRTCPGRTQRLPRPRDVTGLALVKRLQGTPCSLRTTAIPCRHFWSSAVRRPRARLPVRVLRQLLLPSDVAQVDLHLRNR